MDRPAVFLNEHMPVPDIPRQHQSRPQRELALEHGARARVQSDLC